MIKLGDIARDTVTGFEGVVVAITKWLHGCDRVCIQPQKLKDGKPIEGVTFDALQLELVKPMGHRPQTSTGGPRPDIKQSVHSR